MPTSRRSLHPIFTQRSLVGAALATIALASPALADEPEATAPPVVSTATTSAPAEPATPPAPEADKAPPPPPVVAQTTSEPVTVEKSPEEQASTEVNLNGSIDAYSGVNFARPGSNLNKLRAFDTQDGGFALNYAEIVLARNTGKFGFRVDAGFGSASDGLFAVDNASVSMDPDTKAYAKALAHVQQAYVTGRFGKLTIDAGKFVTAHGLEVIETKDNWNYSRSILFNWAIPFFHTGLRATYAVNDKLSVMGCVVNGWNTNLQEGNSMTSACVQAIYKPVAPLSLVVNYIGGREHALGVEELTLRHTVDVNATYAVNDKLSVAMNADYGYDAAGDGVSWAGVAGYGRYQILPNLAAAGRVEYFSDSDGFMTGMKQSIMEGTATLEVSGKLGPSSVLGRLEYRHDRSDAEFFDASMPTSAKSQNTLLIGGVTSF